MQKDILTLLDKGAIVKGNPTPNQLLSTLFLRENKEPGKFRPVINSRELNAHIPYLRLQMETLKESKNILFYGNLHSTFW